MAPAELAIDLRPQSVLAEIAMSNMTSCANKLDVAVLDSSAPLDWDRFQQSSQDVQCASRMLTLTLNLKVPFANDSICCYTVIGSSI